MADRERSVTLDADVSSVRRGRTFARDVVNEWGIEALGDDVQLGVSELITNAVRHAGTGVTLTMRLGDELRVEVTDEYPDAADLAPTPQTDPLATSGRGLHIVEAVSARWGVHAVPGGKVVWFALPLPDKGSADADVFSLRDHREQSEAAANEAEADAAAESREMRAASTKEMQSRRVV